MSQSVTARGAQLPESTIDLGLARVRDGERRYRLGVMGGTFDPIHHGHLVAGSEVAARFNLDEVVFVPTGTPWQKAGRRVSSREDRYLMTVIATASNPRFSVSRVDIDRAGDTYTVDTLRDLKAERGSDVDLFFITGADALASILTWRGADELFDLGVMESRGRPRGISANARRQGDLAGDPGDQLHRWRRGCCGTRRGGACGLLIAEGGYPDRRCWVPLPLPPTDHCALVPTDHCALPPTDQVWKPN